MKATTGTIGAMMLFTVVRQATSFQTLARASCRRNLSKMTSATARGASDNTGDDEILSTSTISFTTEPMGVFIEDTDAYGILYNSNYLKLYDRALHVATASSTQSQLLQTITTSEDFNSIDKSITSTIPWMVSTEQLEDLPISGSHDHWSIVSVEEQRFAAAPQLGDDFVISGTLQSSSSCQEIWDMELKSADGSVVFNTVKGLTISSPSHCEELETEDPDASLGLQNMIYPSTPNITTKEYFRLHRDELDAHWESHLPLRSVLNFFERPRSMAVGGPGGLQRLQFPAEEDGGKGVVVVVTTIQNFQSFYKSHVAGNIDFLVPGLELAVETGFVVKRKGMIIECYQNLLCPSTNASLAQAQINIMMLDAKSRRPTSKLPQWLLERFGVHLQ